MADLGLCRVCAQEPARGDMGPHRYICVECLITAEMVKHVADATDLFDTVHRVKPKTPCTIGDCIEAVEWAWITDGHATPHNFMRYVELSRKFNQAVFGQKPGGDSTDG
jgi:hypothetical protein